MDSNDTLQPAEEPIATHHSVSFETTKETFDKIKYLYEPLWNHRRDYLKIVISLSSAGLALTIGFIELASPNGRFWAIVAWVAFGISVGSSVASIIHMNKILEAPPAMVNNLTNLLDQGSTQAEQYGVILEVMTSVKDADEICGETAFIGLGAFVVGLIAVGIFGIIQISA